MTITTTTVAQDAERVRQVTELLRDEARTVWIVWTFYNTGGRNTDICATKEIAYASLMSDIEESYLLDSDDDENNNEVVEALERLAAGEMHVELYGDEYTIEERDVISVNTFNPSLGLGKPVNI